MGSPNAQCEHCGKELTVTGDGSHPIAAGKVFCPGSSCITAWNMQTMAGRDTTVISPAQFEQRQNHAQS